VQVVGSERGPAGGKLLTKTTFIQRLNTSGGFAPATGCLVPGDVGKQTLAPYTADYFFFRATTERVFRAFSAKALSGTQLLSCR